jgi:phosphatidylserine/phosphatidylglycerophosphate/cardiolipin synthase-like enzyme
VSRQLLQTSAAYRNSVRELLQVVFAGELLSPSRCLWIVSPWLRDIPVIDNTTGSFFTLSPDFPRGEVRLSRVLSELLSRGTYVVIVTRPEPENRQVIDALARSESAQVGHELLFIEQQHVHAKGLVTDRCSLLGSMNFTYQGLDHSTELLLFDTEPQHVEETRLLFLGEYGGRR